MVQTPVPQPSYSVADFERTLIFALEVSDESWVVAAHVPGRCQRQLNSDPV
jgi:hypothetical protein